MKKRVFSLAMALVLVLSMALPAFAEAPPETANALAAYSCPNCYSALVKRSYLNFVRFLRNEPHDSHIDKVLEYKSGYNYICTGCSFWAPATDEPTFYPEVTDCGFMR